MSKTCAFAYPWPQTEPETDRPYDPVPRVTSVEVLSNPFEDIQPRLQATLLVGQPKADVATQGDRCVSQDLLLILFAV
jgi:hypothetical protein